jgi:hypothetical protein
MDGFDMMRCPSFRLASFHTWRADWTIVDAFARTRRADWTVVGVSPTCEFAQSARRVRVGRAND